jgi:hypothetical protein
LNEDHTGSCLPAASVRTQAFTLYLQAADFRQHEAAVHALVAQLLDENPHMTLQVLLEPGDAESIAPAFLADLRRTCYRRTTYLDRFYSILPGPMKGSKRLVLLLDSGERDRLGLETITALGEFAAIVWRGAGVEAIEELGEHEYVALQGLSGLSQVPDGPEGPSYSPFGLIQSIPVIRLR